MLEVLDEETWRARATAHATRVDTLVEAHLSRRRDGVKHPVHDFLFTYYAQRPAQLRRWHPGYGVGLVGADEYAGLKGYAGFETGAGRPPQPTNSPEGQPPHPTSSLVEEVAQQPSRNQVVAVTQEYVESQLPLVESLHRLLTATAGRTANFGCFGLHEWAMVHRASQHGTRHDWPLRLGEEGTDRVVESHRIACSHFDAFRFFTPSARPLNTLSPSSGDRPDFEQPACLHAGMDLYKHAFRLTPMISSDLVADCFELARDIRVLDMRAAPYDLADLGFDPVRIETPEGKQEYVAAQRAFAERGAPLRARLVEECARLLSTRPAPAV